MGPMWRAMQRVASRSPGTCSESLWLLPSGPDQVHDLAMRGDPPLIGAQFPRIAIIPADRDRRQSRCLGRARPGRPGPPAEWSIGPAPPTVIMGLSPVTRCRVRDHILLEYPAARGKAAPVYGGKKIAANL